MWFKLLAMTMCLASIGCGRSSYGSDLDGFCGDGEVQPYEECDDGNLDNDDDCSSKCLRCDYPAESVVFGDNGHCYSRHSGPASLASATTACASVNGHLVTYADGNENDAVAAALLAEVAEVSWLGLVEGGRSWVDGTTSLYTNWADGEPSTTSSDRAAVQRADGLWEVRRQDAAIGFICEVPGWELPESGHAYRVGYERVTWDTARARCEQAGGHLATITSVEEAVFLEERFPVQMWLGASAELDATTFTWVDDEPVEFERWLDSFPRHDGTIRSCATLQPGGWRDHDCTITRIYLCEID